LQIFYEQTEKKMMGKIDTVDAIIPTKSLGFSAWL
jgi:hypothetical protein